MTETLRFIGRFIIIIGAYICALLAAGCFLAVIFYSQLDRLIFALTHQDVRFYLDQFATFSDISHSYAAILIGGSFFAILAGAASFIPAMIVIVLAEIKTYRSSLYYCISGLIIGLIAIIAGPMITMSDRTMTGFLPLIYASFACAGIIAGFVYWLIAGRHAGSDAGHHPAP